MQKPNDCINAFKQDLKTEMSSREVVDKYLVFGTPFIFHENEPTYYELKKAISGFFSINQKDVYMIGSSKLGFSIAPRKMWRIINDESDIDIVIFSEKLFDKFWLSILDFRIELTSRRETEDEDYQRFLNYFFKGWLRPDLFPFHYSDKSMWFDFFKSISYKQFDGRKVSCAIFRNEEFFYRYHVNHIEEIRKGEL